MAVVGRLTDSIVVAAPVRAVFAYVDDWRNIVHFLHGLRRWDPVAGQEHGLGATFEVELEVGPVRERSLVEVTAWEQDRLIAWESREGFRQSGRWVFAADGAGTRVDLEIEYVLPGGIAGRLLAKTAEPLAHHQARASLSDLRKQVERQGG